MPLRLCLWSGPRNVSTALMYAFAQRSDTRVIDEPLYAHYLRVSGADHFGAREVMAAQDTDGDRVVREVVLGPSERPVLFMKHMAHHLVDLDLSFLEQTVNALLIRDPAEMLPSLARKIARPGLRDTGLGDQVDLLRRLERLGQDPPVLDARELLLDPPGVLGRFCERLGLAFEPRMLEWPAGPLPDDGVWAPYWYENVHRSTGFAPYRPKTAPLPDDLRPLLDACRPLYDVLYERALRAQPSAS